MCGGAEPLLQLVGTVLQVDVVMLSVVSGDQFLIMRGKKLESQSATDASPLKRALHKFVTEPSCSNVIVSDTSSDARWVHRLTSHAQGFFSSIENCLSCRQLPLAAVPMWC